MLLTYTLLYLHILSRLRSSRQCIPSVIHLLLTLSQADILAAGRGAIIHSSVLEDPVAGNKQHHRPQQHQPQQPHHPQQHQDPHDARRLRDALHLASPSKSQRFRHLHTPHYPPPSPPRSPALRRTTSQPCLRYSPSAPPGSPRLYGNRQPLSIRDQRLRFLI